MVEGMRMDCPEGSSAARRRRSFHPTVAATMSKTFTMAVPRRKPRGVRRSPGDVVCDSATLAIGHICQGNERGRMRNGVRLFDCVTNCIDVRVVRLVRLVHGDAAARSQFQAGVAWRARRSGRTPMAPTTRSAVEGLFVSASVTVRSLDLTRRSRRFSYTDAVGDERGRTRESPARGRRVEA